MCQDVSKRYRSPIKRTWFSRQLKALTFRQFRNQEASDEDALKKLLEEIERLSCLDNDTYQTENGLCDVLWKVVEGEPWPLHTKAKD